MSRKSTSRRETRRIDTKKERAAVRQALGGGHPTQPQAMNWSTKLDPVPLMDDTPRRPSGRPKKGCPKRKGGKHVPVIQYYTRGSGEWARTYARTVCKHCGKHKWRNERSWEKLPSPSIDHLKASGGHWASHNILARLGGGLCDCTVCTEALDAATEP